MTNSDPLVDLGSQSWPVVSCSNGSQCLISTTVTGSGVIMVSLKCGLLQVPWKYNLVRCSGTTSLFPSPAQYAISEFQLVPLSPKCLDCAVIGGHILPTGSNGTRLFKLDDHLKARICNLLAVKVLSCPGWLQFNGVASRVSYSRIEGAMFSTN